MRRSQSSALCSAEATPAIQSPDPRFQRGMTQREAHMLVIAREGSV